MTSNIGTKYLDSNEYGFGEYTGIDKKNKIDVEIQKRC